MRFWNARQSALKDTCAPTWRPPDSSRRDRFDAGPAESGAGGPEAGACPEIEIFGSSASIDGRLLLFVAENEQIDELHAALVPEIIVVLVGGASVTG